MAQTGTVGRLVANITAIEDTNAADRRVSKYGDGFVQTIGGERHGLADEGSYFVGTNPTPDTGIALTTSITAFAETAGAVSAVLHHTNAETTTVAGSKRIFPDYIKLIVASTFTTGASLRYAVTLNDSALSYTSGGSTITPVNANTETANTSISTIKFGALTTAVPTNRRLLAKGFFRAQVPVVMDAYVLAFGVPPAMAGYWVTAAGVQRLVEVAPPVCISAGWSMILHLWSPSCNAAAQLEFEYGWVER